MAAESPEDTEFQAYKQAEAWVKKRPLDALKVLEPVVAAEPDKSSVHLLAGRAYFHSAQLNRAEKALKRVLEIDPVDHYARFVLGRTLERMGRLTEALAHLRMAAAMNPVPEYQETLTEVRAQIMLKDKK